MEQTTQTSRSEERDMHCAFCKYYKPFSCKCLKLKRTAHYGDLACMYFIHYGELFNDKSKA